MYQQDGNDDFAGRSTLVKTSDQEEKSRFCGRCSFLEGRLKEPSIGTTQNEPENISGALAPLASGNSYRSFDDPTWKLTVSQIPNLETPSGSEHSCDPKAYQSP